MIQLKNVSKHYQISDQVTALKDINLTIKPGTFAVITGPSGSGKSTLLNLIGGLDLPTHGTITINDKDIHKLNDNQLSEYRNQEIGFVFQDFNLNQNLTVEENIKIPTIFNKKNKLTAKELKAKTDELLEITELTERKNHLINQISGGQKQRVAIARALINSPKIILADEPTGNLDSKTGKKIINLLKEIHKNKNITVIIVTHDQEIAKQAEQTIRIENGKLITE